MNDTKFTERDSTQNATSDLLEGMMENHTGDTVTVSELKNAMHERGFGVLMAIACLPLCIPAPLPPGATSIFAIPIFILSAQMIWGMDSPWLPQWICRKRIKRSTLALIVVRSMPVLRRIEGILKPRFTFAATRTGEKIIGIFIFVFALAISMPLPFTNLPPGYGVLIMSLGLLSKDGLIILLGMVIGMLGVAFTLYLIWMGKQAAAALLAGITAWLGI